MLCRFAVFLFLAGFGIGAIAQQSEPLPDADGYYPPGQGIEPPKIVHPSPATFPNDPRLAGLKYSRIVAVSIDAKGKLIDAHLASPNPGPFDASALAAVKSLEFEPAELHRNPVPARVEIWVPFISGQKRAFPEIMPLRLVEYGKENRPPVPLVTPVAKFSDEARAAGLQGVVLVTALVTERGEVQDIRVIRPLGKGLDEKAVEAVREYKFAPALRWGIPVPQQITIEVNFRLCSRNPFP
jgi:TonB family protein